jgi:hypothetical protein
MHAVLVRFAGRALINDVFIERGGLTVPLDLG